MTMKTDKYKVSQELMNDINEWKFRVGHLVIGQDFTVENALPVNLDKWWVGSSEYNSEKNNRLIALIQYVNGEDVFEVEKPKKWVVRTKKRTFNNEYQFLMMYDNDGDRIYAFHADVYSLGNTNVISVATKFDSKEEAEKWSNPLMEVVEVEDE